MKSFPINRCRWITKKLFKHATHACRMRIVRPSNWTKPRCPHFLCKHDLLQFRSTDSTPRKISPSMSPKYANHISLVLSPSKKVSNSFTPPSKITVTYMQEKKYDRLTATFLLRVRQYFEQKLRAANMEKMDYIPDQTAAATGVSGVIISRIKLKTMRKTGLLRVEIKNK